MPKQSATVKVMSDAALKVGKMLMRDFGEVENLQVSEKGPSDYVTAADLKAEKMLMYDLSRARPDYGFLTEETGEIPGKNEEYRWIIDPIDGTVNFIHSLPLFCISLALAKRLPNGREEVQEGVIYAPIYNELYWASKGEGAYMNDRRLMVSSRKTLKSSLIGYGGLGLKKDVFDRNMLALQEVGLQIRRMRLLGSAALELAYIASGKLDGYWHNELKPWDIAAGILLVREAKGMVTEIDGGGNALESGSLLATNGHIHDKLGMVLKKHYK